MILLWLLFGVLIFIEECGDEEKKFYSEITFKI